MMAASVASTPRRTDAGYPHQRGERDERRAAEAGRTAGGVRPAALGGGTWSAHRSTATPLASMSPKPTGQVLMCGRTRDERAARREAATSRRSSACASLRSIPSMVPCPAGQARADGDRRHRKKVIADRGLSGPSRSIEPHDAGDAGLSTRRSRPQRLVELVSHDAARLSLSSRDLLCLSNRRLTMRARRLSSAL